MTPIIDMSQVKHTITRIVEGWTGESLNATQREVLERFMDEKVKTLDKMELLDRMVTPKSTLNWFLAYFQTQVSEQFCRLEPGQSGGCVCHAA